MQSKLGTAVSLKNLVLPRNNHWLKRALLVFTFILFDYFATLAFCRAPYEEANPFARTFMESFGIPLGLTMFVVIMNLPIYVTFTLDSNIVRLPHKVAAVTEPLVDIMFAWFVAGVHFNGGTSWFWHAPELTRQTLGAILYLVTAVILIKSHGSRHGNC